MEESMKEEKNKGSWGRRLLYVVPALCMMIIIFRFSAQPAVVSSELSGSVGYRIVSAVDGTFHLSMTEQEKLDWTEKIQFPIRKGAHMTEYGILALFVYMALWKGIIPHEFQNSRWKRIGLAEMITACYASTDEFHQWFVPGRSAEVRDVLVDSLGAIIALCIMYGMMRFIKFRGNDVRER